MPYSPAQLFALVDDIAAYPQFLPWCRATEVKSREGDRVVASITVAKMGIQKTFTTQNYNESPHKITMKFVDGPFKHLDGVWQFEALADGKGCQIILDIDYELMGGLFDKAFGTVFHSIANSMVDAFCQRAKELYG